MVKPESLSRENLVFWLILAFGLYRFVVQALDHEWLLAFLALAFYLLFAFTMRHAGSIRSSSMLVRATALFAFSTLFFGPTVATLVAPSLIEGDRLAVWRAALVLFMGLQFIWFASASKGELGTSAKLNQR